MSACPAEHICAFVCGSLWTWAPYSVRGALVGLVPDPVCVSVCVVPVVSSVPVSGGLCVGPGRM